MRLDRSSTRLIEARTRVPNPSCEPDAPVSDLNLLSPLSLRTLAPDLMPTPQAKDPDSGAAKSIDWSDFRDHIATGGQRRAAAVAVSQETQGALLPRPHLADVGVAGGDVRRAVRQN